VISTILWAIGAIWGVSGVIVVVLFVLDERAHRRQLAGQPQPSTPVLLKTPTSAVQVEPVESAEPVASVASVEREYAHA
jgi:hypothetical protein